MEAEAVGGLSEAVDQALYGRHQPKSGFGNALYEIKEKRRHGYCKEKYSEERATFYQDFVVIRQASQYACFPLVYDEVVIPRYKLIGAVIEKGVPWSTIKFAFVLLLGVPTARVPSARETQDWNVRAEPPRLWREPPTHVTCVCFV